MSTTAKKWSISIATVMTSTFLLAGTALAASSSYTIQPNDTLWKISQKENVSIAALESLNPNVTAANLQIGQTLAIPSSGGQSISGSTYTVQSGDTEWLIAKRLNVSWAALQAANPQVLPTNLQPGESLNVPATTLPSGSAGASTVSSLPSSGSANSNLYWMTRVIAAEATGQPMNAKLAVGAVVENRMHNPYYASTVQGVVFQQINGIDQFTCVANGWIYQVAPSAEDVTAAKQVLAGTDILPSAFVFYNSAQTPASSWVRTQPVLATYGNLTFAS